MLDLVHDHPGVLALLSTLVVLPLLAAVVAIVLRLWWTLAVALLDLVISVVSVGMLVWLNYNIGTGPDGMDNVVEGFLIIVPVGVSGLFASAALALVLLVLLLDGVVLRPGRFARTAVVSSSAQRIGGR